MDHNRYPEYVWRQTNLGKWERDVDESERFYTLLAKSFEGSGRMFFAMTGFVSLSIDATESSPEETERRLDEALQRAWLGLRHDHPTIASKVEYDHVQKKWKKTYTPFPGEDVRTETAYWLKQTFVSIENGMSGLEWCNSDPPAPDVPTLFSVKPPQSPAGNSQVIRRDLVIRSPHDIMDGIGTLQLLNNLLVLAQKAYETSGESFNATPGSEIINLSPPMRVAAAIPPILSLDQQNRLQEQVASNKALRENVEILTVPYPKGTLVPGKNQRCAHELSESDTALILDACKRLGATVTHVYHAAIALGVRDLQSPGPEARIARYINYSLINERPKCIEPYNSPKHAATVCHSVSGKSLALDLEIPSIEEQKTKDSPKQVEEFLKVVEQVKNYYHAIRDDADNLAMAPAIKSLGTPHISDPSVQITTVPAPNATPTVSISSMGVLDKVISPEHGALKAEDPWVTGEELGTGMGCFLGTWKGKLSFSAAYNDAWHTKEEAEKFLEHCQQIVWNGLELYKAE